MRRPLGTALVAASLALATAAACIGVGACGGSSNAGEQAQAGPSGMSQPNGQTADPSALFRKQLDTLVTRGTITSAQEDAVVAALKESLAQSRPPGAGASPGTQPTPGGQPSAGMRPPDPSTMFSAALDALVKAGTITSAQKTAIADALSSVMGAALPGAQPSAGGSSAQTY